MHAIQVHEFGKADRLIYEEVPLPDPGSGEIRVRVEAIGLNFTEIYQRKGMVPTLKLPLRPGAEFAGVVDAVGGGVTDFKAGDRVATTSGAGGYAEYAIAPASHVLKLPKTLSTEQGAALLLQGLTAHYLVCTTYPLKPGDTALIHAAAGGVGQLLVQVAKKREAQVIATVSTEEKAQLARGAGADQVILYSKDDFQTETRRLTNGAGVDVVYDSVGKDTFLKSIDCLKPRGYMVLYGQASGPVDPINPQLLQQKGSLFLTRPTLVDYIRAQVELRSRADDLFGWIAAGELSLRIDRTFPLADTSAAHQYMEDRQTKGKVLIVP